MKTINEWLAWPFENEVRNYRVMWYWQSTTADDESHLHRYVANAHPMWHARFRLAQWLPRAAAKASDLLGDALAVAYLGARNQVV